jgi:hypothetical protein
MNTMKAVLDTKNLLNNEATYHSQSANQTNHSSDY